MALAGGAFAGGVELLRPVPGAPTTAAAPPPSALSPEAAADVVLVRTTTAAARLSVLAVTDPERRGPLLARTSSDLAAAVDGASDLRTTGVGDQAELDRAVSLLQRLQRVVAALHRCTTAPQPGPGEGAGSTARAACSIDSDEVTLARAAGASAASLLPYASTDATELARLVTEVQRRAEARFAADG